MSNLEPARCRECGDKCCVCEMDDLWAAHCQRCENAIGKGGVVHYCASSKSKAVLMWNDENE